MKMIESVKKLACCAVSLVCGIASADLCGKVDSAVGKIARSPDGKNEIRLYENPLSYEIVRSGMTIVQCSAIGMIGADACDVELVARNDGVAYRFVAAGGRVLETGEMDERDMHRKLAQEAKEFGLPSYPVAIDPKTNLPSYGIETRGVTVDGISRISLCNQSSQMLRVRLKNAGVDLISGLSIAEEFEMRPLEVKLVEY